MWAHGVGGSRTFDAGGEAAARRSLVKGRPHSAAFDAIRVVCAAMVEMLRRTLTDEAATDRRETRSAGDRPAKSA